MLLNPQWIASLNRKSCHFGSDIQTFTVYCYLFYFVYILLLVIHIYFLWHFPSIGCLPTLVTIPVWIGLYRALSNVANEVDMLKRLFCHCQFFFVEQFTFSLPDVYVSSLKRDFWLKVFFGYLLWLVLQQLLLDKMAREYPGFFLLL